MSRKGNLGASQSKAVEQIEKARDLVADVMRRFPDDSRVDMLTEAVELLDDWVERRWDEEVEEQEQRSFVSALRQS
ncbi:MAG: hypothetical protein ACM3JD_06930 [Rudaea sp.]